MSDIQNKIIIRKIALTSVLTSLSVILSIISNFIRMPFASFLTLDISLIPLLVIVYAINFRYAFFSIIATGLSGFIPPNSGGWIGVLINTISHLIFVTTWFSFLQIYKRFTKSNYTSINLSLITSIILISLILTILNGLFFTPLYWWYYGILHSISFIEAMNKYNGGEIGHIMLLGIPNYWLGIFALYISFNLIKFLLISYLFFVVICILIKSKVIEKYFKN